MIIALDGNAASGKGTIGKMLSRELKVVYLDTGRIYRAVAHQLIERGVSREDSHNNPQSFNDQAIEIANSLTIAELHEYQQNEILSGEKIAEIASIISSVAGVRAALLDFQRAVAKYPSGAVLDGRDIGTIVCPDADFKFFITASVEERAKRRYKDLKTRNIQAIYDDVLQDLQSRDERDSVRNVAPMKPASDAILVDTTQMSVDEVFNFILNIVRSDTPDS